MAAYLDNVIIFANIGGPPSALEGGVAGHMQGWVHSQSELMLPRVHGKQIPRAHTRQWQNQAHGGLGESLAQVTNVNDKKEIGVLFIPSKLSFVVHTIVC